MPSASIMTHERMPTGAIDQIPDGDAGVGDGGEDGGAEDFLGELLRGLALKLVAQFLEFAGGALGRVHRFRCMM